ncbi:MAG: hypothetical protein KC503_01570 [Myxococcales bacterium]|nr:hypothetical protein [Myxococcales bacterium]
MKRLTILLSTVALTAIFATGCYVAVDDDLLDIFESDLRVSWRVDGSQRTSLCDTYGIESWRISVSGPDARSITLSCRDNWWSSESDFYSLTHGTYRVTVRALDADGATIGSRTRSIAVYSDFGTFDLPIDFSAADFDASAKKSATK